MRMNTRLPVALEGDDMRVARESGRCVSSHLGNGGVKQATLSINGETVALPASVVPLLAEALSVLGRGEGAAVSSLGALLTVEEAAELLDAKTESVLRMVAEKEIEAEGGKLPLRSVLKKKQRTKEARLAVLAELAALDQEWGMP